MGNLFRWAKDFNKSADKHRTKKSATHSRRFDDGASIQLSYNIGLQQERLIESYTRQLGSDHLTFEGSEADTFYVEDFTSPKKFENDPVMVEPVEGDVVVEEVNPEQTPEDAQPAEQIPTVEVVDTTADSPGNNDKKQLVVPDESKSVIKKTDLEDDEFQKDLRDILEGKKAYDSEQGRVTTHERGRQPSSGVQQQNRSSKPAMELSANEHEIFEKISQSMHHANSYDLGMVNLEQRFEEFDKSLSEDGIDETIISTSSTLSAEDKEPVYQQKDQEQSGAMEHSKGSGSANPEIETAPPEPQGDSEIMKSEAEGEIGESEQDGQASDEIIDATYAEDLGDVSGELTYQDNSEYEPNPLTRSMFLFGIPTPQGVKPILDYFQRFGKKIDFATFAPVSFKYFEKLKELLVWHGVMKDTDSLDYSNYSQPIKDFQQKKGLKVDGIPGQDTLWEMQLEPALQQNMELVKVDADYFEPGRAEKNQGYNFFRLREDLVEDYKKVLEEVHKMGGKLSSAGASRALDKGNSASASAKSLHKMNIALDLNATSGMTYSYFDDAYYYMTRAGTKKWTVYAVADKGEEMTIDAARVDGKTLVSRKVTKKMINLTKIMEDNGFSSIQSRSSFPSTYGAAEWWHFQYEKGLTPFISQFGIEILKLKKYDLDDLKEFSINWDARKSLFKMNWF